MMETYRIDDDRQTVVLDMSNGGIPHVTYWGKRLPAAEDLTALSGASAIDVSGGMLDENPVLSLCPEATHTFPGQVGLIVRNINGAQILPSFSLSNVTEKEGMIITCKDAAHGLTLAFSFETDEQTRVITCQTNLQSDHPICVDWLAAPVLPAPQNSSEMIDFSGRWCGEFQPEHTQWAAGARLRENRTGRTGHEHFPGLMIPNRGATNTSGECFGFHYGWSGGHKMIAEELQDGRRQVQWGHATGSHTAPATYFETAPLYLTYSDRGLNGCAVAFQRHLRDRIVTWPKPDAPRPVHYNCWEAVYFDHHLPTLQDIATRAARLGAERFVLDDGWFGRRDDDTSSLGDWVIDPRKYPDGLTPLVEHVHREGMSFGLWFEPEMVNEESEIYRKNPHWALGAADQILGRQQKVLNMALPEVGEYLFTCISDILSRNEIDYIKWDHNRVLPLVDAEQTQGTYALIDRLRAAFPKVEIESCASGGGRIDFGILSRTQRVWLSDSNDATERLRIQHDAALFLPAAVTGSHVGPRVCHTSGRTLDISYRAWVAAQRHMGFEMDPRELDEREVQILIDVTEWWKENRNWMRTADILRLDSADKAVIAEQQLALVGDRFVVFAAKVATSKQISPRPLRLTGLEADATYQIALRNRGDIDGMSRGNTALKTKNLKLSGTYLMHHGITLPCSFPERMWVIEGTRI
ncbi:alpha-galactosidase [Sulfitobacter donghicola]|uniref:Alpha-galactosidase n=1 Tax=Sulfitobacter donghicola DSW-25 = KCTC 12864 = JCM 14565 TaxID=1300350 RepID=A0A073IF03_9RHOB|nr:alpha-galactosidase [Sulfitobacter donghicola]KEJ88943.1 alpha-galactosidase [Sulfitobacter donghicola DSW-25 = KCTC 12864 = JCM 14565]KIN67511.1 Glycoside hydrolase, clan GH-D [Sulfitobacter donghicola DSW-25 = KCTC 12864 = JCM 14565]